MATRLQNSAAKQFEKIHNQCTRNCIANFTHMHVSERLSVEAVCNRYSSQLLAGQYIYAEVQPGQLAKTKAPGIPPNIVPMFTKFVQPYTRDWIECMQRAIDYVEQKQTGASSDSLFIIIPINSPGGNTDELELMLNLIAQTRSKGKKGTINGVPVDNSIKIVTYGVGMVASCAFALFQSGHICLANANAKFLCHEPKLSGGSQDGVSLHDSEKMLQGLREIKQKIYFLCELSMLHRLCKQTSQRNADVLLAGNEKAEKARKLMRKEWMKQHETYINWFYREQHANGNNKGNHNQMTENDNIFAYITETIADDPHSAFINTKWMQLLSFADLVNVSLEIVSTQTLDFRQSNLFQTTMSNAVQELVN